MPFHGWQYISKRIVGETVRADQAGRRVNVSVGGKLPGFSASAEVRDPDYGNVFELAERATEILDPQVRSLDDPRLESGSVVRAVLNLHEVDFSVWRKWNRNDNVEVASFVTAERYPWGRVFIGLIGSTHNWKLDTTTITPTGRTASDARGLYELIADALEDESEGLAELVNADRKERLSDNRSRFDSALTSFAGSSFVANRAPREVLFVVHDVQRGIGMPVQDMNGRRVGQFDLVILGAPIWVRDAPEEAIVPNSRGMRPYQLGDTPIPRSQLVDPTYVWEQITQRDIWSTAPALRYSEQWPVWDEIASAYADTLVGYPDRLTIDDLRKRVGELMTTPESWSDLSGWFSDQAQSYGGPAVQLHVHPRRRFLPWLYAHADYEPSGRYGRPLLLDACDCSDDSALVLTDGTVVLASPDGFVDSDAAERVIAVEQASPWAVAMLVQAARWRADPVPYDD